MAKGIDASELYGLGRMRYATSRRRRLTYVTTRRPFKKFKNFLYNKMGLHSTQQQFFLILSKIEI